MQIAKKRTELQKLEQSGDNPYIGTTTIMLYTDYVYGLSLTIASGSSQITVNWGDGTKQTFTSSQSSLSHTYSQKGYYLLRISDDISTLKLNGGQYIAWFYAFGYKVTSIPSYAFNSACASGVDRTLQKNYICDIPNVTSIGSYSLDSLKYTKYISFGKMQKLEGVYFYAGGLQFTEKIYMDNVTNIPYSPYPLFTEWATARNLTEVYMRKNTCQQIKSMSGFPWVKSSVTYVYQNCKFFGSDGYVKCDGTIYKN